VYLSDVPTVDVNPAYLAPPPVTSVTDLNFAPQPFVLKLPSAAPLPKPGLSSLEIGAIALAALIVLYLPGKRR
jgi:hypothetical protein